MTTTNLILSGLFAVFISGCAATGPRYSDATSTQKTVSNSNARITFFRTKENSQYSGRTASVKIDNSKSVNCDYGGFNTLDVSAGKHVIAVDMWDSPGKCELSIDVAGGSTYFFEIKPRLESFLSFLGAGIVGAAIESGGNQCGGAFSITPVEQNAALPKINELSATN